MEKMKSLGIDARGTTRQEYASFIASQLERMKEAVKLSGAPPAN